MPDLSYYSKHRDQICLVYSGQDKSVPILLDYLKPFLIQTYPEANFSFCITDHICGNNIPLSHFKNYRFGIVKEIKSKPNESTLFDIVKDIDFPSREIKKSGICYICQSACYPNSNLTESQIEKIISIYPCHEIVNNCDQIKNGFCVGAAGEFLYFAATQGIYTELVPSGPDIFFYKKVFSGKILDL